MSNRPSIPLAEAAKIVAGITLGRKTRESNLIDVPYVRVANVQDGYLQMDDLQTVAASKREIENLALIEGDILLTEGGDIDKLGRGACWRAQVPLCIHQNHIFRVRLPSERYDPDYVSYQIGSPYGKAYFLANAKKTTGIASINQRVLGAFPLVSPPLHEQREIAERLRTQLGQVEIARKAADTQRKEMGILAAAVYREAFSQMMPISAPPILDDPPAGWQWQKLTDIARLESGHTPSKSRPDWWGGDVSWISLTEIRALDGRWTDSTQLRINKYGIANSAARILPSGTVCFSRTASVGFATIMGQPMATSQDFANWVCGDALDPEYLMHALIRARDKLRELATGATHKTIYMPTLESFRICAPVLTEQQRIVRALKDRLVEIAGLRSALESQQRELDALPQLLLAQAFEI
jgi:restriction endonuclease S subunit